MPRNGDLSNIGCPDVDTAGESHTNADIPETQRPSPKSGKVSVHSKHWGPPLTFSNSSRMGEGKWPDTQSAASRPRAIASATEETPKRHMTESVSPYTTWGGARVTRGAGRCWAAPALPTPAPGPSQAAAGRQEAPDLGAGAIAVLHRVLGLHELLRLLNHLAPEPGDTLLGRESCSMRAQRPSEGTRAWAPTSAAPPGMSMGELLSLWASASKSEKWATELLLNGGP